MNIKLPNRIYRWAFSREARLIVGVVLALVVCFFISRRTTIVRIASAQTVATPFVLETEAYYFESNPDGELFHKETVARRSDGATALVSSMGPVAWGQTSRRLTFTDGTVGSLVDLVGAKTTWSTRSAQRAALVKAQLLYHSQNCANVGDTLLGFSTLLNQRVAVLSRPIPDGEKLTKWVALSLGCQTLRYRVETKQPDGSFKLKTESKPVSLTLEEPDPRLFDEGPGYVELRPSVVLSNVLHAMGIQEDADLKEQGQFMDGNYNYAK